MIAEIVLFLAITIGKWFMLLPVSLLAGGLNAIRSKINPQAYAAEKELEEIKGNPELIPVSGSAGFLTVLVTKWAFDKYDAEFTWWIVAISATITLVHGVKNFSDGARVMGHIRVGSALGIFAWLLVSLF